MTVSGGVERPGVFEVPLGTPIGEVLRVSGVTGRLGAVLVGGYFGAWLPAARAVDVALSVDELRRAGGGLGAGIVVAMPADGTCALAEVARATRWLADQNAGQCGPCVNGLDSIAGAMATLVAGDRRGRAQAQLASWLSMMEGRGACKHPDGVTRFVSSSLRVFAAEVEHHRHGGQCTAGDRQILPTPRTGGWR